MTACPLLIHCARAALITAGKLSLWNVNDLICNQDPSFGATLKTLTRATYTLCTFHLAAPAMLSLDGLWQNVTWIMAKGFGFKIKEPRDPIQMFTNLNRRSQKCELNC
jgi:hypothetical protein